MKARAVPVDEFGERPHIEAMRRSYRRGGLNEPDLAPTWLEQFRRWFTDARQTAEITEPNAMVLATADSEGRPSARTVLLKGVDAEGFRLYTNLNSRKGREATANPHASLVFGWYAQQRQVVVIGRVKPLAGAESDAYFASRPRGSQLSAAASPQSDAVESRTALEDRRAELAALYPEGQAVPRPAHWGGLLVVPESVEFWQGREDRLHDRLRFISPEPASSQWRIERLAP